MQASLQHCLKNLVESIGNRNISFLFISINFSNIHIFKYKYSNHLAYNLWISFHNNNYNNPSILFITLFLPFLKSWSNNFF